MFDDFTILDPEVLTGLIKQFTGPPDVPFLDMFRTSTNVMGDSVGSVVINRLEGREDTGLNSDSE